MPRHDSKKAPQMEMSVSVKGGGPPAGEMSLDPDVENNGESDLEEGTAAVAKKHATFEAPRLDGSDDRSAGTEHGKHRRRSTHTILQKISLSLEDAHLEEKLKPPVNVGVLICVIPLAIVLFAIRYRHHQLDGGDSGDHGSAYGYGSDSSSDSSDSSSYSSSSYSSSSYSSSSSSSYSSGGGHDDHSLPTVFMLASTINPESASYVLAVIILVTMVLDFLVELLNEFAEYCGEVYQQLSQKLYQELMLLGIISFVIFLMNTEGYFDDKMHLFHEVEYGHLIIFYLGIGLLIQGSVLAIINKEIKVLWKYSISRTAKDLGNEFENERESFLGEWKIRNGMTPLRRHIDIHLVRITFCDMMSLPPSFAYNEYVNHALDTTTVKIASCTPTSWAALVLFIMACAHVQGGGLFFGTDEDSFWWFGVFGTFLMGINAVMLVAITMAKNTVLSKMGGVPNAAEALVTLKQKWAEAEERQVTLADLKKRTEEERHKKHKKQPPKEAKRKLSNARVKLQGVAAFAKVAASAKPKLDIEPEDFDKFQFWFIKCLRFVNLLQAFYISMIICHWAWYATSHGNAIIMLIPLLIIYLIFTPRIVRRYAMVMSLGKPMPKSLSKTIEYMEHNERALTSVAEELYKQNIQTESDLDALFNEWDTSGDGELDFKELEEALFHSNLHMPEARFKAMWRKIDVDSSGTIDNDEFKRAVKPYLDQVRKGVERGANSGRSYSSDSVDDG